MTLTPANNGAVVPAETAADAFVANVMDRIQATGRYVGANAFMAMAMNAQTLEEATDIGEVISGKEHMNERIRYFGVQFLDSDPELDSPVPIFALCDVVREMGDGTHEKMSIGAGHVLGVLIMACEKNLFPFDAELVSVGLSGARKAINLQLAPTRVQATQDF